MSELHFYKKGKAVRLTDQAHAILAAKSDEFGISQKEIASEAILMLHKKEERQRRLLADVAQLEKKVQDYKRFAGGLFILGAVAGGCVMFFVGVLW